MTRSTYAAAFSIPVMASAWAWAHAPAGVEAETQPLEDVGAIQDITATTTQPEAGNLTLAQIAGRMHPAAVHLPIGWIVLLTLWEVLVAIRRRQELDRVGMCLGVGAILSTIPAIVSGFLRAEQLPQNPATLEEIADHRNIMLVASAFLVGAMLLRFYRREGPIAGQRRLIYLALLCVASILVGVGGHWGGALVFGQAYLPF